jgi:hypothetical protein
VSQGDDKPKCTLVAPPRVMPRKAHDLDGNDLMVMMPHTTGKPLYLAATLGGLTTVPEVSTSSRPR